MYITNVPTRPAGMFSGPMVVSMRPIPREQIVRAVQVTSRFPDTHGAPVHIGDPSAIGIRDIDNPEFGDAVEIRPGETPVFWACGVTPPGRRPHMQAPADDHPRPRQDVHHRPPRLPTTP